MGNQNVKAIVGVVLLIAGIALIIWQVKRMSNDPGKNTLITEAQQKGQTALESFFGQVNGKWSNDALWIDKATKTAGVTAAKEIFGDSPNMADIKIIDAATDTEYQNQIDLVLQVGNAEQCVFVNLREVNTKYVIVELRKDTMTISEYKKNYL